MNSDEEKNFNKIWGRISHLFEEGTKREIKARAKILLEETERSKKNYSKTAIAKAVWLAAKAAREELQINKYITLKMIGRAIGCSPSTISKREI